MDIFSKFSDDIKKFNAMYGMPVADAPAFISTKRLKDFKAILAKELDEIDDVIELAEKIESEPSVNAVHELRHELQVALADLLGDLQVYCASEMAKWGLPLDETLRIIMQSNFSKMGADGNPIYDEQGKLQKGPDYWKPEPRLSLLLESATLHAADVALCKQATELDKQAGSLRRRALGLGVEEKAG